LRNAPRLSEGGRDLATFGAAGSDEAVDRAEATEHVTELGERLEPVAPVVPPHILESLAMEDRWINVNVSHC
jgi:hypothetical protein